MKIVLHKENLKLVFEVQLMSELENSMFQHFNFKTDYIDTVNEFYEELILSDTITIDNQVTSQIKKIKIEKYETFAVIRVDVA